MLIKFLYFMFGVFFFLSPVLLCFTILVILKSIKGKINKKIRITIMFLSFLISIGLFYMFKDAGIESIKNAKNAEVIENNKLLIKSDSSDDIKSPNEDEVDFYKRIDEHRKKEKGIDISKYQEDIDWDLVAKDNIDYAMIRLGYRGYETGKINYDSYFKKNMKGALSNGIKVGCYFGSTAISKSEIKAEVEFILKNVKNYNITMPLAIAWRQDKSPDSRAADISNKKAKVLLNYYCKLIADAGYKPLIYLTKDWLDDLEYNFDYPLWINTNGKKKKPNVSNLLIWQYTDSGKVSGVSGKADLNYCYE